MGPFLVLPLGRTPTLGLTGFKLRVMNPCLFLIFYMATPWHTNESVATLKLKQH